MRVMDREQGQGVDLRFGLVAGLTPGQRFALERRGHWRCPTCGSPFDPAGFLVGELECDCGTSWTVRPLPERGDAWFDWHTALGQRVVTWLIENTEHGQRVPTPTALSRIIDARKTDVVHVYEALVFDGTLERHEKPRRYVRIAQSTVMRHWRPTHLSIWARAS